MISCNEDDGNPTIEIDRETVELETWADADFDEIDDLSAIGVIAAESNARIGARLAEEINDERFTCADVVLDRENKIITIDFGEECEGPRGRKRSGIIRVTYSGFWFRPGSVITTTLENFFIDGRKIEGTRTVTNITDSVDGIPTFRIELQGGKITFPDGSIATREVNRVRQWIRAENPLNDEYHILTETVISGTTRNGTSYEVTIDDPLVYKRKCRSALVFLPVSGAKIITSGDNVIVMDFGDGECDNILTVSFNGRIETIEYSVRSQS